MTSPFEQKVNKVAQFLPQNKDIFTAFAQFQTVQQVPQAIKLKYFNDNIKQIARMMTEAVYKQKQADNIDQVEVITDLEEWLSGGDVKFKLRPKQEVKTERIERIQKKPQVVQRNVQNQMPQQNVMPKLQRIQNIQQQPVQNGQPIAYTQPYQQSRPQSYYQTQPTQGRQNTIKYTPKLPQMQHPDLTPSSKQQLNIKKIQYEKQNVMWIDSLSKCFTYPEKRFYLMPEMHAKRKY